MNCKACGGEARPQYDEYKGRRYVMMYWCDECDEEVLLEGCVSQNQEDRGFTDKEVKNES